MSINFTKTTKYGYTVTIRNLNSVEQVQQIHNTWAEKEGWSPCATDPECFVEIDPHGFFVAEVDDEGKEEKRIVAIVSGLAYDEDYGFIGLYIADPNERGKGYGLAVFEAAMDYLGKERTIGLEGVVAQQANYQKSGFETICHNMRHTIDVATVKQKANNGDGVTGYTSGTNHRIVAIDQVAIEDLSAYDKQIFLHDRQPFLAKWVSRPGAHAFAAVTSDNTIVGYGVVRPCGGVYRVGPLFADSQQIAENLFVKLAEAVPHEDWQICTDGALSSENLNNLVAKYDMKPIFPFARMYRRGTNKEMPQDRIDRIYGISSVEVG